MIVVEDSPAEDAAPGDKTTKTVAKKVAPKAVKKVAKKAVKKVAKKVAKKAVAKKAVRKTAPKKAAKTVDSPARTAGRKGQSKDRILRIRLRGFDYKQIDAATDNIVRTVRNLGSTIRGPIPLPVSRERYDLLRSPHVDKDSREQLEIRTHHRLMDIIAPSPKTTDALTRIDLPEGVDVNMKVI